MHRHPRSRLIALWATILLAGGLQSVSAQQPPGDAAAAAPGTVAPGLAIRQIDVSGFPKLTVSVNVNDPAGDPLRDLGTGDFRLTEDGKPVPGDQVSVTTVKRERERGGDPLSLALAIDVSASMLAANAMDAAKAAASEFVSQLPPGEKVALFSFGNEVIKVQEFTDNRDVLVDRIGRLEALPGTGTALYEAIYQAATAAGARPGRRGFIIVTDGWNDVDRRAVPRTLDDALQAARDARAPGYALGFGSAYDEALTRVAADTGGQYLRRPQAAGVRQLFGSLSGLLQSQYLVTYPSQLALDGESHQLEVEVATGEGTYRDTMAFDLPRATPTVITTTRPPATRRVTIPAPSTPTRSVPPPPPPPPSMAWWPLLLLFLGGLALVFLARRAGGSPGPGPSGRVAEINIRESQEDVLVTPPSGSGPPTAGGVAGVGAADTIIRRPGVVAFLVATQGSMAGIRHELNPAGETNIGRMGDNDIVLDEASVSRYHAKVRREGDAFVIFDLAAANPVRVNGEPILRHELRDGDRVTLGNTDFTFKLVDVTRSVTS